MMEFGYGYRPNNEIKMKHLMKGKGIRLNLSSDSILIIKLPDSRVLRVMSRSLFMAMVIISLPSILGIIRGPSPSISLYESSEVGFDSIGFKLLPVILRDLADEGILKEGNKALIVTSGRSGFTDLMEASQVLNKLDVDLISESDLNVQTSVADQLFDVMFTWRSHSTDFIDRVLKVGGIVVMQLSNDPSPAFRQQLNYRIVYLRRFATTVVAMRKMSSSDQSSANSPPRRLCGVTPEAKRVALRGLEDALMEPPRRPIANPHNNSKKFKFLPDLLGDSLEEYRRRIFITDENNGGVVEWFRDNYPTRNQHFEIHSLRNGVSDAEMVNDWGLVMKDVREEDFVVMKAEAQVVEVIMREKKMCLVDELFLECKNQWQEDGEEEESRGKRAYWECLALYGRLRDEGVAVHQWWG